MVQAQLSGTVLPSWGEREKRWDEKFSLDFSINQARPMKTGHTRPRKIDRKTDRQDRWYLLSSAKESNLKRPHVWDCVVYIWTAAQYSVAAIKKLLICWYEPCANTGISTSYTDSAER